MNRQPDYRTDLYSLGVTFYEVLSGKLPFTSEDVIEVIYAHIAVPPKSIVGIPDKLNELLRYLLAKNPEDRYQSAYGLKEDLLKIQAAVYAGNALDPITLRANDISSVTGLSEKLYGREEEISQLETRPLPRHVATNVAS